ncbi:solute carrier family 25 member 32-like [Penaeus indicus]|uniref:solute carrier family 25 member 32-like n=1 Tax=Penaeus indicus TaxID=29960 RepID=UPI00300D7435
MNRSKKYTNPFAGVRYEHLVAGVSGGVASTLILHPLDLLKIRFAVSDSSATATKPHYTGLTQALGQILRHEGIKGLYRGVTPNVWGAGSAWGLYFLLIFEDLAEHSVIIGSVIGFGDGGGTRRWQFYFRAIVLTPPGSDFEKKSRKMQSELRSLEPRTHPSRQPITGRGATYVIAM